MEKGVVACNDQFLLSHSDFYPFSKLFAIVNRFRIVVCKPFQSGRVQNLLFGKGLKVTWFPTGKTICFSQSEIELLSHALNIEVYVEQY